MAPVQWGKRCPHLTSLNTLCHRWDRVLTYQGGVYHPYSNRSWLLASWPATAQHPSVSCDLLPLLSDIIPNPLLSLVSSKKKFDSIKNTEKLQTPTFSTELIISGRFVASYDPWVLLSASTSGTDFPLFFPYSKHYSDLLNTDRDRAYFQ